MNSNGNGHHPIHPTLVDMQVTAPAIRALLAGEEIDDFYHIERFGQYCALMERLFLTFAADPKLLKAHWYTEAKDFPALAAFVGGFAGDGLVKPKDLDHALWEAYQGMGPHSLSTGWTDVDRIYRVMPGELTLLVGTPSSGKTRWISALMVNMAQLHKWRFAVFSPEMGTPRRHLELMLCQAVGKPFRKDQPGRMSWAEAQCGAAWLDPYVTFLDPKKALPTVDYLIESATALVETEQINALCIDPWNRMAKVNVKDDSTTEGIGQALQRLAAFGAQHQVHVFIVVHPTKVYKGTYGAEPDQFPVVTPNMIYGSSYFWDMPDNILSIWRDITNENSPLVEIHTQKIRMEENGRMGCKAQLYYHQKTSRYSEVTHVQP